MGTRDSEGNNPASVAPSAATLKITDKVVCSSYYFINRK